jgi:2-deoxy-D-gluconate 3-dehydrogenase
MSADLFSLAGRNVVFTGATRGIGAACAIALAKAGATGIALVQRDRSNLVTHDTIKSLGTRVEIIEADLSDLDAVKRIFPWALELFGEIHVLVNCAGIQRRHPATEFPERDWDEVSRRDPVGYRWG